MQRNINHEHQVEFPQIDKIKAHIKAHKEAYVAGVGGVVFAGITCIIVRGIASQPTGVGIVPDASHGGIVSVMGKGAAMSNVSFISSNRQGSPSWVVRCLDTDEVFTSQRKAAIAKDISQSELSKHLKGSRDSVRDLHFERICMAA